jgi:dehydrogenase/reductase SDR family protein 1
MILCFNLYKNSQSSQEAFADLFAQSETTEFAGKSIVALAADPNRIQKSGKIHITADLAAEYGFKDINGNA